MCADVRIQEDELPRITLVIPRMHSEGQSLRVPTTSRSTTSEMIRFLIQGSSNEAENPVPLS